VSEDSDFTGSPAGSDAAAVSVVARQAEDLAALAAAHRVAAAHHVVFKQI